MLAAWSLKGTRQGYSAAPVEAGARVSPCEMLRSRLQTCDKLWPEGGLSSSHRSAGSQPLRVCSA